VFVVEYRIAGFGLALVLVSLIISGDLNSTTGFSNLCSQ
jgi:hypothetical protein